ncbi:MAG: hypothetical protein R2861_04560 [Desulfobacterales bacterium]
MKPRKAELPNSFYDGYTFWGGGNYVGDGWKTYADYSFMEADIGIPAPAVFSKDYFKDEKHHRLALGFETDTPAGSADRFSVDFGWQRQPLIATVSRRIKFHLSCRVIWKLISGSTSILTR